MKIVMKGNKQLRVADDCVNEYEKVGYVEIDETTGKPLRAPEPKGEKALKKINEQLVKQVKALTAELEALRGGAPPA